MCKKLLHFPRTTLQGLMQLGRCEMRQASGWPSTAEILPSRGVHPSGDTISQDFSPTASIRAPDLPQCSLLSWSAGNFVSRCEKNLQCKSILRAIADGVKNSQATQIVAEMSCSFLDMFGVTRCLEGHIPTHLQIEQNRGLLWESLVVLIQSLPFPLQEHIFCIECTGRSLQQLWA